MGARLARLRPGERRPRARAALPGAVHRALVSRERSPALGNSSRNGSPPLDPDDALDSRHPGPAAHRKARTRPPLGRRDAQPPHLLALRYLGELLRLPQVPVDDARAGGRGRDALDSLPPPARSRASPAHLPQEPVLLQHVRRGHGSGTEGRADGHRPSHRRLSPALPLDEAAAEGARFAPHAPGPLARRARPPSRRDGRNGAMSDPAKTGKRMAPTLAALGGLVAGFALGIVFHG